MSKRLHADPRFKNEKCVWFTYNSMFVGCCPMLSSMPMVDRGIKSSNAVDYERKMFASHDKPFWLGVVPMDNGVFNAVAIKKHVILQSYCTEDTIILARCIFGETLDPFSSG